MKVPPFWDEDPGWAVPGGETGLEGLYAARLWDLECLLELKLDAAGGLAGRFSADGEMLEVAIDTPSTPGEARGVLQARHLGETFASFCATVQAGDLLLELSLPESGDPRPTATERALFRRVAP